MQVRQPRPWLKLLPLLALYLALTVVIHPRLGPCQGDEGRYLDFARNLLRGYYSPPGTVDLWNGPGYPILLASVAWSPYALFIARVANAFLLYAALLYLQRTLAGWMTLRRSILLAGLFGLYPPALRYMPYALTETLAILLICGLAYHSLVMFEATGRRRLLHAALAAAYFAWLALTKVFFGVVLATLLASSLIVWLLVRSPAVRTAAATLAAAFILCTPWLFYTWNLTGRVMYWSTAGGSTLYWMSSPYAEESGDWFGSLASTEGNNLTLRSHHQALYESVSSLPAHEADRVMTQKAINNIRHHPGKYFKNWTANIGRLLFNYPFSYTEQKMSSFYYIIPNSVFLAFGGLAVILLVYRWRSVTAAPRFLLALFTISLAGSSLVSAYGRMFTVIAPLLYVITLYALSVLVEIRWKGAPAGLASPES